MPLFDIVASSYQIPPEKRVPLADILAMHRQVYKFESSLGTMLLRRLTQLDLEAVSIKLSKEHPEYAKIGAQAAPLWQMLEGGGQLSPEEMERLQALAEQLQPYTHEYAVRCFIEPAIKDGTELSHLLFEMKAKDEREKLLMLLTLLANPSPDGKVETVGLLLSQEFGIPLAEGLTVENMPAQTATVLTSAIRDKQEALRRGLE
jgi:hypothetical protein